MLGTVCRHCRAPLDDLERRRGDICSRAPCRRAADLDRQAARREADVVQRRRANAVDAGARLVWLQDHDTSLVRLTAGERQAHEAHLHHLVDGSAAPVAPLSEAAGESVPGVCAFCRGRCCRLGARLHAFVSRPMLERWADARPGATLREAADAYASRLPDRHVRDSCVYHGRSGCELPREMRAEICNRFVCEGLVDAARQLDTGARSLVVAMAAGGRVTRAAEVDGDAVRRTLPRRPRA